MDFSTAKQSFKDMKTKISSQQIIIALLGATCFLLAFKVVFQKEKWIPSNFNETAEVGYFQASATYYRGSAFELVNIVSGITPNTAEFWAKELEHRFDPEIWSWLGPQILQIKARPQITNMSTYSFFKPNETNQAIEYEPSTGIFFITGKITSSAFNKNSEQLLASVETTYEVGMHMVAGKPTVNHWRVYTGKPMTKKWKEQNPEQAAKREEEIKNQANLLIPKPKPHEIIYEDTPVTIGQPQGNQPAQAVQQNPEVMPAASSLIPVPVSGVQLPAPISTTTGNPLPTNVQQNDDKL